MLNNINNAAAVLMTSTCTCYAEIATYKTKTVHTYMFARE